VAVVRRTLDPDQQEQIRRVLAAAVGASFERGDTVVVHTLDTALAAPGSSSSRPPDDQTPPTNTRALLAKPVIPAGRADTRVEPVVKPWIALVFLTALGAIAAVLLLVARKRRAGAAAFAEAPLTEAQRRVALAKVQAWLAADAATESVGEGR
jgi:flagellar M-ring protein FliF